MAALGQDGPREGAQATPDRDAATAPPPLPDARALLDALPVPAFVLADGPAGPVLARVNPALCRLTGYGEADLLGRPLETLRSPHADAAAWAGVRASAASEPFSGEVLCARREGGSFWGEVALAPLGEGVRLGRIVDVSRRVDAEGALRLSQQREALGLLTNSVAHEFNNFLQILIGYIDGLKRRLGERPEPFVQRAVTRSTEAAERAAVLTRHLLAHARRIAPDLRPVDLDGLIADLAGPLQAGLPPGTRLAVRPSPGLAPALCNPLQVELALRHLVANAAEATDPGAEATIEIASFAVPTGDQGLQRPSDGAVGLSVTDRGQGMSAEMLTRALAPFATSREAGRGVGLAVVHSLMKRQNGSITLDSRPGEGTSVRLVFPAAPRPQEGPAPD